ncbi:histone-lysine N-methyltransferase SETMAR [Trichonephila clavipes]|nr:histone-lysine N-methyltransferase SETMAR [Trichonephila clavipes]
MVVCELSCSYFDSDEDIRLSESDYEEFEESADKIDNIPVNPDIYVERRDPYQFSQGHSQKGFIQMHAMRLKHHNYGRMNTKDYSNGKEYFLLHSREYILVLLLFESVSGIIYKEFLLERTTVNGARYIEIATRFMKRLRLSTTKIMVLRSRQCSPSDSQNHPTVPDKKGVVQSEHPPYLPNLNPPGFFLFLRLKLALKGKRFDDIPDIQRNVTRLLNSIPKEDFWQSFQDMFSRSQLCIVMGDNYFEEQ